MRMQPLESRPQAARILAFRKFKRICKLHLNRVPFGYTPTVSECGPVDGHNRGWLLPGPRGGGDPGPDSGGRVTQALLRESQWLERSPTIWRAWRCAPLGRGDLGDLGALRGGDSGGRRPSPWSYRKVQPFPQWGWEIGLHSRYEICHRCGFVETVAALPGNSGSAHAIRLGIKPFAKLGANSLSLSGSEGDSPCSRRTILGLAPVTVLQSLSRL
jgi:hypothetical protein